MSLAHRFGWDGNSTRGSRGEQAFADALKVCSPHYRAARIFSALIAILYLSPSIYMMQVYDRVLTSRGLLTLFFLSALVVFALIVHSYLEGSRQRLLSRAALRLDQVLSPKLVRAGFETRDRVDARNAQILREFDTYRQYMQGPGTTGMMDLPFAPLFVIVAFGFHPLLGSLILGGAMLLVGLALLGERATRKHTAEAAAKMPAAYASAEMNHVSRGTIRALGMRGAMSGRLIAERSRLNQSEARNHFVAGRYAGMIRLLRMVLQSASLGVGAYLAVREEISGGALIAASILTGRALAPIEQIVGSWRQITLARAAKTAIIGVLDGLADETPRQALPAPKSSLSAEGITVRAPGQDRLLLADVSFSVAAGEILGVIGPSGAGKSTLARALVGAQIPTAGTIRVDGANIADWDADDLGAHLGYLPQDSVLFAGTIGENICRFSADPEAGKGVVPAAQVAGAHEMIQRFPQGYNSMLGLRGEGVSAGQAQRVALARALYGEPGIIVLDEPNAHLDSEGDASLVATLKLAKARGACVIIMTHRSGVLGVADKLLVLRDGQVEKFGPREQVLSELKNASIRPVEARRIVGGAA
ncbi:MAG TPA: type I secretion system permease/ATPase [Hyphomonadaceae bacterium]|nr:type I secretion system permease/ATPase [Hyphomonadaceae bacterium]HPI48145.1 type I secretion system permease/ATPase [Hyphomonadaceae bacterium]